MSDEIIYPRDKNVAIIGEVVLPMGQRGMDPSEVSNLIRNVAAMPYVGTDPRKKGMTLAEAAVLEMWTQAADGDIDALDKALNRVVGKPMQTVVQATGTLKEFLDGIAKSEPRTAEDIDPFSE